MQKIRLPQPPQPPPLPPSLRTSFNPFLSLTCSVTSLLTLWFYLSISLPSAVLPHSLLPSPLSHPSHSLLLSLSPSLPPSIPSSLPVPLSNCPLSLFLPPSLPHPSTRPTSQSLSLVSSYSIFIDLSQHSSLAFFLASLHISLSYSLIRWARSPSTGALCVDVSVSLRLGHSEDSATSQILRLHIVGC